VKDVTTREKRVFLNKVALTPEQRKWITIIKEFGTRSISDVVRDGLRHEVFVILGGIAERDALPFDYIAKTRFNIDPEKVIPA